MLRRRQPLLPIATVLTIVWLSGVMAWARANEPALTAIEEAFLADVADGQLDEFPLLQAGLIASGVTCPQRMKQYQQHFEAVLPRLADELATVTEPHERAETIYRFLHERLLIGEYRASCTELDRAFDHGDFNCVTATILYHCLCRAHDLFPVAVATKTHVRSRLDDKSPFDVETTCPTWFEVARRDPQAQVFRTQQQATRRLSDIELLGKVYYNRGVSLLEAKSYPSALHLLRMSQSLDAADEPTRENLIAGINNWALTTCDASRFCQAAELVQQGLELEPENGSLLANDLHVHQQWALALCAEERFEEALQLLEQAHRRRSDVALFDLGRYAVHGQWVAYLLQSRHFDEAWQVIEEAQSRFGHTSVLAEYQAQALASAVESLVDRGHLAEAGRLLEQCRRYLPHHPKLQSVAACLAAPTL